MPAGSNTPEEEQNNWISSNAVCRFIVSMCPGVLTKLLQSFVQKHGCLAAHLQARVGGGQRNGRGYAFRGKNTYAGKGFQYRGTDSTDHAPTRIGRAEVLVGAAAHTCSSRNLISPVVRAARSGCRYFELN